MSGRRRWNIDWLMIQQRRWSSETFGDESFNDGTNAVRHIELETEEVSREIYLYRLARAVDLPEAEEHRQNLIVELADVILLVLDIAWRNRITSGELWGALRMKQIINRSRSWEPFDPDDPTKPRRHV